MKSYNNSVCVTVVGEIYGPIGKCHLCDGRIKVFVYKGVGGVSNFMITHVITYQYDVFIIKYFLYAPNKIINKHNCYNR